MKQKIGNDGSIKAIYGFSGETKLSRPLVGTRVPAGFPSPSTDYLEGILDLNLHLVKHPASTFFIRVEGYSMVGAGIFPDDLLIVDRAVDPSNNKIIVAIYDNELTLKRLMIEEDAYILRSENPDFPDIKLDRELDFYVWGVVTYVIHKV